MQGNDSLHVMHTSFYVRHYFFLCRTFIGLKVRQRVRWCTSLQIFDGKARALSPMHHAISPTKMNPIPHASLALPRRGKATMQTPYPYGVRLKMHGVRLRCKATMHGLCNPLQGKGYGLIRRSYRCINIFSSAIGVIVHTPTLCWGGKQEVDRLQSLYPYTHTPCKATLITSRHTPLHLRCMG